MAAFRRYLSMFFVVELLIVAWLSLIPVCLIPGPIQFWDKAQHAMEFLGLTVTGLLAHPRRTVSLGLGLMSYGALIEVSQSSFTTTRSGEVSDWFADVAGLFIGYLLACLISMIGSFSPVRC